MIKFRYIKLMAINSFSVSVSNVISTNSMLNSISITPSFSSLATINYIGKDIVGQLAGLYYTVKTGKQADNKPEKYIFKGVISQQIAFLLENSASVILNKNLIFPFLAVSSALKNVSFISIGAVNACNLKKLSGNEIGDFYSKVASINTLFSSLGMLVGLGIVYYVPSYHIKTFIILPILGYISYYSLREGTRMA